MRNDILELRLKILLLEFGRNRVIQALAQIEEVSETAIQAQLSQARITKVAKRAAASPTPEQILERLSLSPTRREKLMAFAREFENKRFLGELRLVIKFFREYQLGASPKSRSKALPKILQVLAGLSDDKLSELMANLSAGESNSGFSSLAGAIMGSKNHI